VINPAIFLSPLETKEPVLSSLIEGTVTTIYGVFKYEVDLKPENNRRNTDLTAEKKFESMISRLDLLAVMEGDLGRAMYPNIPAR
jgi:hypothetical protein